jgi:bifunctional DNA-binding transcriptional regulator/antitoxin component of YhaV-PrlF toxin-antitoxin module
MISFNTDHSIEALYLIDKFSQNHEFDHLTQSIHINLGGYQTDYHADFEVNPTESIKNSLTHEQIYKHLKTNHIRAPRIIEINRKTSFPVIGRRYVHHDGDDICLIDHIDEALKSECDLFIEPLNIHEEFLVHIADLKIFYIESLVTNKESYDEILIRTKLFGYERQKINITDHPLYEKISTLALKAIHATNLDIACVKVGVSKTNTLYVLDISNHLGGISEECLDAYYSEIRLMVLSFIEFKNKNESDITIGADPELLVMDKNTSELIPASYLIKDEGEIGLDSRTLEGGKLVLPVLELRPSYSTNPIDVYNSIEKLFKELEDKFSFQNIGLYAGSAPHYHYWIGGHIHFGIKSSSKLIRALDNYLNLPLLMISQTTTARQRNRTYGFLGNYRNKDHGGFEYCSLGSWLISPQITLGVLCLAKVVVSEFYYLKDIYIVNHLDSRAYYSVNKNYFTDKVKNIINQIRSTKSYGLYKKDIDVIFRMIERHETWDETIDIKSSWGLSDGHQSYSFNQQIYIPKEIRKKYDIALKQPIQIEVGKSVIEVNVYQKDDSSHEKEGLVSFSNDVHQKLGLSKNMEFRLFKSLTHNFKVGPVLGILIDSTTFQTQSSYIISYLKRFLKLSLNKGMISYLFSIDDINYDEKKIKGYIYQVSTNEWINHDYPLPDLIYITHSTLPLYDRFTKLTHNYHIKLVNDLNAIKLVNDQLEINRVLMNDPMTNSYIPEMSTLSFNSLNYMLYKFNHIYLKSNVFKQKNIMYQIKKIDSKKYILVKLDTYKRIESDVINSKELYTLIEELIYTHSDSHIFLQQGIEQQVIDDKPVEMVALLQKNGKGLWTRSALIATTINHEHRDTISLKTVLGSKEALVRAEIEQITKHVLTILEKRIGALAEIIIHFTIDQEFNPYIINLDLNLHNLLPILSLKRRYIIMNRLLDYSKSLVGG